MRMYFAGVDLAWGGRNPTGVEVLDAKGRLVHLGAVREDAEVLAALRSYVEHDCLVGFDAPLVVTNPTGQRPAETALNRDFRRFEAGTHPVNTGKPEFAEGPRGWPWRWALTWIPSLPRAGVLSRSTRTLRPWLCFACRAR
jgi:predicted RNase H-like nuclease